MAAGILLLDAISHVPFAHLRLEGRATLFVSIKLMNVITTLGMNIYLVVMKGMGLDGIFLSVAAASAVTTFSVLSATAGSLQFAFNSSSVSSLLKFGLPFLPAGLASIAMESIDRYILASLTDAATVGIYTAGYKLGIFMLLITTAFQYAWQPFFLKAGNNPESKTLFARVFSYFMVIALFVWTVITLFISEIVRLNVAGVSLIGPAFVGAQSIVPIILMAYVFQGAYLNFLPGIYFEEKTKYIAVITGLSAAVNIGVNFALIPIYGIAGAAYATLAGHGTMAVTTYFTSNWTISHIIDDGLADVYTIKNSPDGRFVAFTHGEELSVHWTSNGTELYNVHNHSGYTLGLDWSPDFISDNSSHFFKCKTGQ